MIQLSALVFNSFKTICSDKGIMKVHEGTTINVCVCHHSVCISNADTDNKEVAFEVTRYRKLSLNT